MQNARQQPHPPAVPHTNTLGIIYLCLGVFVFSLQDAVIKQVSGNYPLTQVVSMRSVVAIPILLALVQFDVGWRALRPSQFGAVLARSVILLLSYTFYFLAFPALPLVYAVALYFTVPLFVTALAGPILGEYSGVKVWSAIAIGFVGVLIILQPGSGLFEPAAFLSLLSACMYATAMLMGRRIGGGAASSVMSFHQNWVYLAGALAIAALAGLSGLAEHVQHPSLVFLFRPWVWPSLGDSLLIGSCGVIAAVGMVLLTNAYRVARANLVTSFEYTGVLWAPLWGFLFFSEVPRLTTILGGALIVGAGLIAVRLGRH